MYLRFVTCGMNEDWYMRLVGRGVWLFVVDDKAEKRTILMKREAGVKDG